MGLKDIDKHEITEEDPKLQAIIFPNPEDEEMEKYIDDEDKAREYYLNAKWLKDRLGHNSSTVVGKLIGAIILGEEEDDWSKLDELVETLKGEDDS